MLAEIRKQRNTESKDYEQEERTGWGLTEAQRFSQLCSRSEKCDRLFKTKMKTGYQEKNMLLDFLPIKFSYQLL